MGSERLLLIHLDMGMTSGAGLGELHERQTERGGRRPERDTALSWRGRTWSLRNPGWKPRRTPGEGAPATAGATVLNLHRNRSASGAYFYM